MSAEADDLAQALEKLLVAQRAGVVARWLFGNVDRGIAIRVQTRDGHDVQAFGATVGGAVDALVLKLAAHLEGKA